MFTLVPYGAGLHIREFFCVQQQLDTFILPMLLYYR